MAERFGPQTLTPEHQATIRDHVARLRGLTGIAFPTMYGELNKTFRVAKYSDIPEARWAEAATWLQTRITTAEKRRGQQGQHGE